MLNPDPDVNVVGDKVWFGVLTWVQPEEQVKDGDQQLVGATFSLVAATDLRVSARSSGCIRRRI